MCVIIHVLLSMILIHFLLYHKIFFTYQFFYIFFCKPPYAGTQVQRKKCEGKRIFFEREEFQMKFYSEKLNKLFDT